MEWEDSWDDDQGRSKDLPLMHECFHSHYFATTKALYERQPYLAEVFNKSMAMDRYYNSPAEAIKRVNENLELNGDNIRECNSAFIQAYSIGKAVCKLSRI